MQIPPIDGLYEPNSPKPPSYWLALKLLERVGRWEGTGSIDSAQDLLSFIKSNKFDLETYIMDGAIRTGRDMREMVRKFDQAISKLEAIISGSGDDPTSTIEDFKLFAELMKAAR